MRREVASYKDYAECLARWIQAGIRDPRTGSGHLRRRLVGRSGRDVLPAARPVDGEAVEASAQRTRYDTKACSGWLMASPEDAGLPVMKQSWLPYTITNCRDDTLMENTIAFVHQWWSTLRPHPNKGWW